ncbi:MAG: methyltransferase domain-containing protein [Nanoarchaeota archaeon]|nr:methyltransferase domain-containing protein [Nanoarchaeota archaeon]
MKLHLGCGNDYRKGYVNCDWTNEVKVDRIVDLEKPLKMFKDNSVEEVIANHVLEHINNFVPLMHELHRVCKNRAIIRVKTPFYSAWGQYNDPTHVRFFSPFTFNYFKKNNYSHQVGANKDMFHVKKVQINFGIGNSSKLNWLFNPLINFHHAFYCRFFAFILPASEMEYELVVIK